MPSVLSESAKVVGSFEREREEERNGGEYGALTLGHLCLRALFTYSLPSLRYSPVSSQTFSLISLLSNLHLPFLSSSFYRPMYIKSPFAFSMQ